MAATTTTVEVLAVAAMTAVTAVAAVATVAGGWGGDTSSRAGHGGDTSSHGGRGADASSRMNFSAQVMNTLPLTNTDHQSARALRALAEYLFHGQRAQRVSDTSDESSLEFFALPRLSSASYGK